MKKFISVTLKIIAVAAIAAAVAYGIYRLLNAERRPIAVFKSNFDDEDIITDAPESVPDGDCDAVCAVDMCMPY